MMAHLNLNLSVFILALGSLLILGKNATAQTAGNLDLSFGNAGKVITPIGNQFDFARSVVIQSDGKIVVAGSAAFGADDFALARYNPDGSLDISFDGDGKVNTPFANTTDVIYAIAIQSDGKIVAAGSSGNFTGSDFALARYNTNGSLDTSFDGDGKLTTDMGSSVDVAYAVAIQPDGKVVAGGVGFSLARYNTDGSLDTSFDGDGKVLTTPIGDANGVRAIQEIAIQSDSKIVGAGYAWISGEKFALIRYNPDGSLDTSFDGDGKVTTQFGESEAAANDVAIQFDDKIVLAGQSDNGSDGEFALARYNTDGSLDSSFDGDGKVTTNLVAGKEGANGVAIQSNGKIVVAGGSSNNNELDFTLARYNADGSLDNTFDGDGKVITSINSGNDFANAVAIQSDGKIVAAGITSVGSNVDFAVVRYIGDSVATRSTPFDFDGDSKADVSVYRPSEGTWYLLNSSNSSFSGTQFGVSNDKLAPADFDGDGRTDISVFRHGFWYRLNSSTNQFVAVHWGQTGDIPVPADYDGDSKVDLAVFRNGFWYILQSSNNQFKVVQFGVLTDKSVQADFDGDGKTDVAVFRDGNWYWLQSTDNQFRGVQFGIAGDIPVVGDYDGDLKTDQAVFRNGVWYLNRSRDGFTGLQFGLSTDIPTPADYDGDSKADIAVFREGNWYRLNSSNNQFFAAQFGLATDKAVPSAFVP